MGRYYERRNSIELPDRDEIVALDCEFIGVGHPKSQGGQKQRNGVASVSIISGHGELIYHTLVKSDVRRIIKNKIVVGHDVQKDLNALGLHHPMELIRDTAKLRYPGGPSRSGEKSRLKDLAEYYLDISIQNGPHSSADDAEASLDLYLMFQSEIEKNYQ